MHFPVLLPTAGVLPTVIGHIPHGLLKKAKFFPSVIPPYEDLPVRRVYWAGFGKRGDSVSCFGVFIHVSDDFDEKANIILWVLFCALFYVRVGN